MKKGMSKRIISLLCLLSLALTGCGKSNETVTDVSIQTMVENGDVAKVESEVLKNIKTLNKEEQSNKIDKLISSMYVAATNEAYQITAYSKELSKLLDDGIDLNSNEAKNKVNSNAEKGLFEDLQENHLLLKNESGQFYVVPNLEYISKKYSNYMSEELNDIVSFRNDENTQPIYNAKLKMVDIQLIVDRELKIEDMLKKYTEGGYNYQWKTYQAYYMENLFGQNHILFFTSDKTKITSYAMDAYKKIIEDYPDSLIAKNVKGYMDLLNEDTITPESSKYVEDIINGYKEELNVQTTTTDDNGQNIENTESQTITDSNESK